jgi:glycosyltransferase Alg8
VILTVYILALMVLALNASDLILQPEAQSLVIVLCLLGAWRVGFGLAHLVRALVYRWHRFPRLRQAADALGDEGRASHVYIVVTPVRIRPETTARVFQAALAEAGRYGAPATLIALVAEEAERRLIKQVFRSAGPPPEIRLVFLPHPGRAENKGLAAALRAVSRMMPADDAVLLVIDGRVLLGVGTFARSLPFLRLLPEVGGVTTARESVGDGGPFVRAVRSLRAAEHHRLACSLALTGGRIPTSGRLSMHRVAEVVRPDAILAIEQHGVDARLGGSMLYAPDVKAIVIGQIPKRRPRGRVGWLARLPRILRLSEWARDDAPAVNGASARWWRMERRVAFWMPPIGLAAALLFAFQASPAVLWVYGLWIGMIALLRTASHFVLRFQFSGLWAISMVAGELMSAVVRPWVAASSGHCPAAKIGATGSARRPSTAIHVSSCLRGLALGILLVVLALASGILRLPPIGALAAVF